MHWGVLEIVKREYFAGCSDVPDFIPIGFEFRIDNCDQEIYSDVEFSSVVKQRFWNILLDNVCSVLGFGGEDFIYLL